MADLTTLAKVKLDGKISGTDADRDSVLESIIDGVSQDMQNWMDRPITQLTATDEKIDSIGDIRIQTMHYPIISVTTLTEDGTALVEDTDFEMQEDDLKRGHIVRISGNYAIAWARGLRVVKITYVHGYATVPVGLEIAANALVLQRFNETVQSGKGWRGLVSKGVDPSATTTYDKDIWTRDIIPAMTPYRRQVA
jgi:hypothetical protein